MTTTDGPTSGQAPLDDDMRAHTSDHAEGDDPDEVSEHHAERHHSQQPSEGDDD